MPADYERNLDQEDPSLIVNGVQFPLTRVTREKGFSKFQGAEGVPQQYSISGKKVTLYPTPDDTFVIFWPYILKDVLLSSTTPVEDNLWSDNAYALLMAKAGIAMAQSIRDEAALQNFTADFTAAYLEVRNDTIAREETNFDQARGE